MISNIINIILEQKLNSVYGIELSHMLIYDKRVKILVDKIFNNNIGKTG